MSEDTDSVFGRAHAVEVENTAGVTAPPAVEGLLLVFGQLVDELQLRLYSDN